jgi:multidrug efflux system outer membrane protein
MKHLPLLIAGIVAGCAVGPDYKRPDNSTPASWHLAKDEAKPEASVGQLADLAWWSEFNDPVLSALIDEAFLNNKDLRIALARVDEAAGTLSTTRSQFFPQLGGEVTGQRARQSGAQTAIYGYPNGVTGENYQANLLLSWEIDIFGKLRRATEAAQADLLSVEENRRAVALALAAIVTQSYIALLDYDQQLEISRRTLRSRDEVVKLFELRFKGGVVSALELAQARAERDTAQVAVPTLEQAVAQQENALSKLLGRLPGPIVRGKPLRELSVPVPPLGLPSDLLERRPDIRAAEQQLVAANARIGVAKAAFFPTFSLTGLAGSLSPTWGSLMSGPMKQWSYGAAVSMPIFTAGGLMGQLTGAEARQRAALAQYQGSIESGFREVADALVGSQKGRELADGRRQQVLDYGEYAHLARLRYEGGYSSYLEVLNAEDRLFSSEINHSQAQAGALIAIVNLYKALGGGWQVAAATTVPLAPDSTQAKAAQTVKTE